MKDVTEIGAAMEKQASAKIGELMKAQASTGLPLPLAQDVQNMIAGALRGEFGQLLVAVGTTNDGGKARHVRLLVFPDEIIKPDVKPSIIQPPTES